MILLLGTPLVGFTLGGGAPITLNLSDADVRW